jgi:hypothetical protein
VNEPRILFGVFHCATRVARTGIPLTFDGDFILGLFVEQALDFSQQQMSKKGDVS